MLDVIRPEAGKQLRLRRKIAKVEALATRPGTAEEGQNASNRLEALRQDLAASSLPDNRVFGTAQVKPRKIWSKKVNLVPFSSKRPEEISIYLQQILSTPSFRSRVKPGEMAIDDWIMDVSVRRRYAYALAEASAYMSKDLREIPDMNPRVIKTDGTVIRVDGVVYGLKIDVPVSMNLIYKMTYNFCLASYGDHPALMGSIEQIGDFLRETAAMASSLFNDVDYLEFVHSVCGGDYRPPPGLAEALANEKTYRALRWNDQSAGQEIERSRKRLRLPKLYIDGSEVTQRQLRGNELGWDAGIAYAFTKSQTWRDAENQAGYIRSAARNILRGLAKETTDTGEFARAADAGVTLRSITSIFKGGTDLDPLVELAGDRLKFNRAEAFRLAGFDAEMIAYAEAMAKGKKGIELLAHLALKTGNPWDALRADRVGKRVKTHRGQFRAALIKLATLEVDRAGSPVTRRPVTDAKHVDEDGTCRAEGYSNGNNFRVEERVDAEEGADYRGLGGSLTHYRQRFFPTTRRTYAHVWDDGNGRMHGIYASPWTVVRHNVSRYPVVLRTNRSECYGPECAITDFDDKTTPPLLVRSRPLAWALREPKPYIPSPEAIRLYRLHMDRLRSARINPIIPGLPLAGSEDAESLKRRNESGESRFERLAGKRMAGFSSALMFDRKRAWFQSKESARPKAAGCRVIDAGAQDYGVHSPLLPSAQGDVAHPPSSNDTYSPDLRKQGKSDLICAVDSRPSISIYGNPTITSKPSYHVRKDLEKNFANYESKLRTYTESDGRVVKAGSMLGSVASPHAPVWITRK